MVSVIRRMYKLRALLGIRIGPGAAILPKDVKRIHMEFAVKQNDGHLGPRKFWREHLPRLKYHNPAVAMTVSQTTDQSGPATMTIFYTSSSTITVPSTSTLPNNAPQERTVSIDMKHIPASEILSRLSRLTGLETIRATPEEEAMLQNMEEDAKVRQADAKRSVIQQEQRRREADMLRQAKGEMVGQA